MSLKSPLGRVLGLGSARSGTQHWLGQRLSAMAMVPLTLWFAVSLLTLPALDFYALSAWVAAPLNAVLMVLLVATLVYHSGLGTAVVAEDYIHDPGLRAGVLIFLRLLHILLAVAGVLAVLVVVTRVPL
jgi:succinate dehydrogenase / fumarate reductase, membrane anchor subunit